MQQTVITTVIMLMLAMTGSPLQAQEPSVLIQYTNVVQQSVSETLTVYGQVWADPDAVLTVSLPHGGLITRLTVRLGQRVKRGDTLFELATSPAAHMQYLQARSAVDYAQRELNRLQRLHQEQLAVNAQVDAARKALQDARASLQALEAQKQNKTTETVSAPTDGIITQLAVNQGDRVQADTAALSIATGNRLIALLGVEPEDIRFLQPGTPVMVKSVFVPGYQAESHLREIHAMINPATHLVDALVPIPEDQTDHLVLGSRLIAEIRLKTHTGMVVPRNAVMQDQQGSYVFRVVGGTAQRVAVTTGLESDQWTEITSGLQPDEAVVSVGNYELKDGMPVREGK
jgi:RND family efflux transporter MFP subunit